MIFWIILLALLIFFVIRPLWRGWRLYKQWQDSTRSFREAYQQMYRENTQRSYRNEQKKKKKIDPEVGEYVSFEEINVTEPKTNEYNQHTVTYKEQQIEEADWEDVK